MLNITSNLPSWRCLRHLQRRNRNEKYLPTDIILHYRNLPGNTQDWITIVPIDTPNDQYHEWFFTQGATEGSYQFSPLEAGEYEVRVYFDWPGGGYEVESKYTFTVID